MTSLRDIADDINHWGKGLALVLLMLLAGVVLP